MATSQRASAVAVSSGILLGVVGLCCILFGLMAMAGFFDGDEDNPYTVPMAWKIGPLVFGVAACAIPLVLSLIWTFRQATPPPVTLDSGWPEDWHDRRQ